VCSRELSFCDPLADHHAILIAHYRELAYVVCSLGIEPHPVVLIVPFPSRNCEQDHLACRTYT
jgi:hypothetical protein